MSLPVRSSMHINEVCRCATGPHSTNPTHSFAGVYGQCAFGTSVLGAKCKHGVRRVSSHMTGFDMHTPGHDWGIARGMPN